MEQRRAFNFSAGSSMLPLPVPEKATIGAIEGVHRVRVIRLAD